GFFDVERHMEEERSVVGSDLAGMTATVHVPAMLNFEDNGQLFTRQINLIGVDEKTYASVSDFSKYLLHPQNQHPLDFQLQEDGYAPSRPDFPPSGWKYRRLKARYDAQVNEARSELQRAALPDGLPQPPGLH